MAFLVQPITDMGHSITQSHNDFGTKGGGTKNIAASENYQGPSRFRQIANISESEHLKEQVLS